MLKKLQQKWKVNSLQLALILFTFAIGGSLTGLAARKLMPYLGIGSKGLWIAVYILLITLIWPLAVLLISIPFGQFSFFTRYLQKIGRRMGLSSRHKSGNEEAAPVQIAVFASGNGSNARQIIHFFNTEGRSLGKVTLLVTNNPKAGILDFARQENIPVLLLEKTRFLQSGYAGELKAAGIGFVALAGFLWKLPQSLVQAFPGRVVNIHPALLPNYGGKGMYGRHVHRAVLDHQEKESGITIHYVDEQYDHGAAIFQATCPVLPGDTPETLAARVQQLEHTHYPRVIASLLMSR